LGIYIFLHFATTEDIWLKSALESREGRFIDFKKALQRAGREIHTEYDAIEGQEAKTGKTLLSPHPYGFVPH